MGAGQSKDELLYQQVNYGNIEGIKALRRDGAGVEWMDSEGKTPLILACLRADLFLVAEALIQLGANVNAYRPGSHAGTPLHHAAKRGLDQTVDLLLANGANPLLMNDDCQTALDLARAKGHGNVIRRIESRICIFSGWLRELYGPGFLEALAPQWVSRKIWAVVLPCDSRNTRNSVKFELAMYPDLQVAKPRAIIRLWKVHIEEPKFNQHDPVIVMMDKATNTRYKFLSAREGDKQQLQWFYNACRGMPQLNVPVGPPPPAIPVQSPLQPNPYVFATPAGASTRPTENLDLANVMDASTQSALAEGVNPSSDVQPITMTSSSNGWGSSSDNATLNGWGPPSSDSPLKVSNEMHLNEPTVGSYNRWSAAEVGQPGASVNGSASQSQENQPAMITSAHSTTTTELVPSAPPINDEMFYDGPIHYPSIDSSPIDLTVPAINIKPVTTTSEVKDASTSSADPSSSCVICLDAPVEGACIPCGHMAGCMACLKEIKAKKWGCPVCRADIDQVVKLYAV